jgi:predicted transcriptional regulator
MPESANAADARRFTAALRRLTVRKLRDEQHMTWTAIAKRLSISHPSAIALYRHSKRRNGAVQHSTVETA